MNNVTSVQREHLDRLLERDRSAQVRWHDGRGVASLLRGALGPAAELRADPREQPEEVLKRFLDEHGPLVGPADVLETHRFVQASVSRRGHVRIRAMQTVEGIPIHGATLLLFADRKRGVFRAQSGFYRDAKVPKLVYGRRPVDVKEREASMRKRLARTLLADREGARFVKQKLAEGFGEDQVAQQNFPLAAPPVYCLYPMSKGLRHAFRLHAYQPMEWLGLDGQPRVDVDLADIVVDVVTGRTVKIGGRFGVWADVNADGQSTLQESGSYVTRPLIAVREDGADRLLVNRDHTPHIITHDAAGVKAGLETKFKNDTHISRDANGHWDDTTTSCTAADRRDSQQPEADAHFFAEQAFNFYDALGWTGMDNGEWGAAACVVRVAAHIGLDDNAYFWRYIEGGQHFGYVAFYDGICDGTTLTYDFMAGDPGIFAHEYQHAVTYFGAVDAAGDPGYLEIDFWHRAIHEALSDAMAGLRTEQWIAPALWPSGACRNSEPFRRIEYPRSTDTKDSLDYVDHYDDRMGAGSPYRNSTLLSHAIFLAGQGGIHERTTRAAELIPVKGVGRQAIAEVLHYAVTELFDNIPANADGVQTMIEAANLILDAAEEITGTQRSCEYVMLRRAFWAVGLYPFDATFTKQTYGGEACMIPWTIAWHRSRPYLGFPALWYKSPDLFVHNGAGPEYDAEVGSENNLFARVRNVGDQDLTNVVVRFYFRAHGTNLPASSTQWKPCQDSGGSDCVLTIPTLTAGGMNFTDENNPPAAQGVKWYLDASEVVAGVDHFCIRAEIECTADNHDNDCANYVQSNVSHSQPAAGDGLDFTFMVANWENEPIPLDLVIDDDALPADAKLHYVGPGHPKEIRLDPGKEMPLRWKVELPPVGRRWLKPPYDGAVIGAVSGSELEAKFEGQLSDVTVQKRRLVAARDEVALAGLLAGRVFRGRRRKTYKLIGRFEGVLDRSDGSLTGVWVATLARGRREPLRDLKFKLEGVLRPTRAIHFTQRVDGEPVGGVTFHLRWPE